MVERFLINSLSNNAQNFATHWKDKIRQLDHLKHYNALSDIELINMNSPIYPLMARRLEHELELSELGKFFINQGKDRMRRNFAISETIYGISLSERTVIEYIMDNFVHDEPFKMYATMGVVTQVADFFLLGCFYIIKGFLEETCIHMSTHSEVPKEILKKYFKDDFFEDN